MNGMRTARKYIERQSTQELLELRELARKDTTYEGMVVYCLIVSELERRKAKQ